MPKDSQNPTKAFARPALTQHGAQTQTLRQAERRTNALGQGRRRKTREGAETAPVYAARGSVFSYKSICSRGVSSLWALNHPTFSFPREPPPCAIAWARCASRISWAAAWHCRLQRQSIHLSSNNDFKSCRQAVSAAWRLPSSRAAGAVPFSCLWSSGSLMQVGIVAQTVRLLQAYVFI